MYFGNGFMMKRHMRDAVNNYPYYIYKPRPVLIESFIIQVTYP